MDSLEINFSVLVVFLTPVSVSFMSNLSTASPTVRGSIRSLGCSAYLCFYFFFWLCLVPGTNCLNWKIAGAAFVWLISSWSYWQLYSRFCLVFQSKKMYIAFIFYWSLYSFYFSCSSALVVAIKSIFDWCQYYYHFIMAIYLSEHAVGSRALEFATQSSRCALKLVQWKAKKKSNKFNCLSKLANRID